MKKSAPFTPEQTTARLQSMGALILAKRKALRLSAVATAEAAGISRVTLHRIEKGEPSVTMGAWCNVMSALNIAWPVQDTTLAPSSATQSTLNNIPVRISLADYPQLKALAWHVQGTDTVSPLEALDIYERNARHLDKTAMQPSELALWSGLQQVFTRGQEHV
jgi:transcriptional regulator with XRE-family HTH domain